MEKSLPAIPAKRYFTIGEVSDLCGVKPYVLRYWEQEFTQLKPMKRRGNRRYYQHHEVLLIRRIRELLYEQGFTIIGARNQLSELASGTTSQSSTAAPQTSEAVKAAGTTGVTFSNAGHSVQPSVAAMSPSVVVQAKSLEITDLSGEQLRQELIAIRDLLAA